MSLAVISGAAGIALASTIIFLLIAKSWHALARGTLETTRFPHSIMLEAAQRFRDELERLGREQSLYLVAAVIFAVIFVIIYLLPPRDMLDALPGWQLLVTLGLFVCSAAYLAYRLVRIIVAKRRLAFIRDANMATGHSLQKLTQNRNRVFHDVPCGSRIIDNVVVGLHGIYAISVIARRPANDNRVRLQGDKLYFAPGKTAVSVTRGGAKSTRLARELGELIGQPVRVRSVVAVPGWEVESQSSEDYLIVNERNLAMFCGWKDERDFLMTEDVLRIQDLLTRRCTRYS